MFSRPLTTDIPLVISKRRQLKEALIREKVYNTHAKF